MFVAVQPPDDVLDHLDDFLDARRDAADFRWTLREHLHVTLAFLAEVQDRARDDLEARCRGEANRRWLDEAAREAQAHDALGLVIALQADPWAAKTSVYAPLLTQVGEIARRVAKPVLFVHGDTHVYRLDAPFVDAHGAPIANLTRLETYGSPLVGWIDVTVDPSDPRLFRFEPHLHALVPWGGPPQ